MYDEGVNNDFNDIVMIFVCIIIGIIIFRWISSYMSWKKDENAPRMTIQAKVVSKRMDIRYPHNEGGSRSSTKYFVTFEDTGKERVEVQLKGIDYGILVEGDIGSLTYQGTRYIAFERNK